MKNRNSIGFRIEAGPNISHNPDLGANAGEAPRKPLSRLGRAKLGASLLVGAYLNPPSERDIQAAIDEEDRHKVVRSEMDMDTGAITEVYGDGRRVDVEPYRPAEMPEAPAQPAVQPPETKPEV